MFLSVVANFAWMLCTWHFQGAVSTICTNCSVLEEHARTIGYSFHFEHVNWLEGLERCSKNHATLAEITDAMTMNHLTTYLSENVPANISGMWIGLRQASPGATSFIWQSDVHRFEESYCVTRGHGEVNCAPDMRVTATDCHNLGCCWKPLGQKCYIPNYVNICQEAQPDKVRACRIKQTGSRHDRKRNCLEAGCCWKDWPRLSPSDAHPPCFYMSDEVPPLNFTKWVSTPQEATGRALRKCVILSREERWLWEVRDCDEGQGGFGFLCQHDEFSGPTMETLIRGTDHVQLDHVDTSEVTSSMVQIKWLNFTTRRNATEIPASVYSQVKFYTDEEIGISNDLYTGYSVDFNHKHVTSTGSVTLTENGFTLLSESHKVLIGAVVLVILLLVAFVFMVFIWRKRRKLRSRGNSYDKDYSEPFEPPITTGALFCVNPAYFHDIYTESVAYEELGFHKITTSSLPTRQSDSRQSDTIRAGPASELQLTERCIPPMYESPPSPRACVPLYLQPCDNPHTECHGYDIVPVPSIRCENTPLYDIPSYVPRDSGRNPSNLP